MPNGHGAIRTTGPFSGLAVTATANAPAAHNLGALLNTLDGIRQRSSAHGDLAGIPAQLTTPGGDVRGTTITRGRITVDIAMNTNVVCVAAPHGFAVRSTPIRDANARTSQMGCFSTAVPVASLPSVRGHDKTGAWLVALVPDHVTNVRVTADDGRARSQPSRTTSPSQLLPTPDSPRSTSNLRRDAATTAPTGRTRAACGKDARVDAR